MPNKNNHPLALVHRQREDIAEGAARITLTNRQIAWLQKFGLVAYPDQTYYDSTGCFALAPRHRDARDGKAGRRKRMNLVPVTSVEV